MCGFAGILDVSGSSSNEQFKAVVLGMAESLRHRGPDDLGAWVDGGAGIALGFRRLSIVDLSPLGHQPMESATGRYVLAFNGEVYNFKDIRRAIEDELGANARFRGHSDTEVMLAAIEAWGVDAAVRRFVGMFAFALWDRADRVLHIARDRMGEKPLYYGWAGSSFIFGSELKALRRHPQFRGEINRDALVPYLRHGYVPTPCSIYAGLFKLPPGTLLTLRDPRPGTIPSPTPYWSIAKTAEAGEADPFDGTEAQAGEELERLLRQAVGEQMVADVPLGAFLSGGVDSSVIVALMQAQSERAVRTFTIGFREFGFDESEHARAVANHLGTDHTELYVTPADALAVIPRLPTLYDEPFADSTQIPAYLVAELARRSVTVALSGDGGDELFGGYPWYPRTGGIWNKMRWLPGPVRRTAAGALRTLSTRERFFRAVRPVMPAGSRRRMSGDTAQQVAQLMTAANGPEGLHQWMLSKWNGHAGLVIGASEPRTHLTDSNAWADVSDAQSLMCFDMQTYLPDDILTKVDRASMGASLESRAPFLDHRVVEFVWRLPLAMKVRGGVTKSVLRKVLYKHVPQKLIERPKAGFNVPIDSWLRGPLRDWAEALLGPQRLKREGFLNAAPIERKWREHLSGERDWQDHLWHVLMFQTWLEAQKRD
jgi:asparagine synthase (glutamine-hydrolysing)